MSVLKFFKLLENPLVAPSTNKVLLDPKGLLTQQFEVGKRAAEHGITAAALGCFDKKLRIVWISRFPFALQFLS